MTSKSTDKSDLWYLHFGKFIMGLDSLDNTKVSKQN